MVTFTELLHDSAAKAMLRSKPQFRKDSLAQVALISRKSEENLR